MAGGINTSQWLLAAVALLPNQLSLSVIGPSRCPYDHWSARLPDECDTEFTMATALHLQWSGVILFGHLWLDDCFSRAISL